MINSQRAQRIHKNGVCVVIRTGWLYGQQNKYNMVRLHELALQHFWEKKRFAKRFYSIGILCVNLKTPKFKIRVSEWQQRNMSKIKKFF